MSNEDQERRREAIRQLLSKGPAKTQGALVAALRADGHGATQSSVSRDLQMLGAVKTASGYELATDAQNDTDHFASVSDMLREVRPAGPNLVIVSTAIGAAQRVALALDRSDWPEVVGNIGGDDTVFVATASATGQKRLTSKIDRAVAR
jgi:transcriptional regulator of arginine metabolism